MNQNKTQVKENPLAAMLNAAHNRFYYSNVHNSYLRMSWIDYETSQLKLESCPTHQIFDFSRGIGKAQKGVKYILWHKGKNKKQDILELIPVSREDLRKPKSFVLDLGGDETKIKSTKSL